MSIFKCQFQSAVRIAVSLKQTIAVVQGERHVFQSAVRIAVSLKPMA